MGIADPILLAGATNRFALKTQFTYSRDIYTEQTRRSLAPTYVVVAHSELRRFQPGKDHHTGTASTELLVT